ncbi:MAG: primosomal protein N' [Betaproteobacteria bacterium]|nr:MAG: primosomal protein N' [Betaproteobacteria bacterium]
MTILRVALDLPLPHLFDYSCDDATDADIGMRVLVPFGNKQLVGVIVGLADTTEVDSQKLKTAVRVLREIPALTCDWLDLARFCSDYYHRPLGEVIFNGLPRQLRQAALMPALRQVMAYRISERGREALAQLPARTKVKRALLQALSQSDCTEQVLLAQSQSAKAALAELRGAEWIEHYPLPAQPISGRFVEKLALNDEQRQALQQIEAAGPGYGVFLLHGITGSGKTEIYLRLIARALAAGRQALVLVPEINLTPRLTQEFSQRFPDTPLVSLHSGLADGERTQHWLRSQSGAAAIVLGTRLAVFVPLPKLGLIVVDEEQDASFKQQDGLRYSARDVAVFRARQAGIPIVLGSATPALETYARALSGRYRLLQLAQRAVPQAQLPLVHAVDMRKHKLEDGLAPPVLEALAERLARGEQSLVFLNRRGYAPVLMCPACDWVSGCRRCSTRMVLHLADRQLRCHHCGASTRIPRHCPDCGNADIHPFGRGTQRLETTLAARFPQARILRVDRDSTSKKGSFSRMLSEIQGGRADILVGTQIMAKGHDFPNLTLVAVVNADSALFSADYRAPERLFAQLVQVAGRAGRADLPGEVLIQTQYPRHPLYLALAQHDYSGFALTLLTEREQAGFPPFVFEAVLRAEAAELATALAFLRDAAVLAGTPPEDITLYDPVPMSVARLAERERAHLLVQSVSRKALQAYLAAWSAKLHALPQRAVRWHLDVDPIEF